MSDQFIDRQREFLRLISSAAHPKRHLARLGKSHTKIDEAISDLDLTSHLGRTLSLSVYPMIGAATRIGVIDFDDHVKGNTSEWNVMRDYIVRTRTWISSHGIKSMAFRSGGGRGAHVWVLFRNPQPGGVVREFLRSALAAAGLKEGAKGIAAGEGEIIPKSPDAGIGYGNAISLPLSRQSVPLDDDGNPQVRESWSPPAEADLFNSDLSGFEPPVTVPQVKRNYAGASEQTISGAMSHLDASDYATWILMALIVKHELGDGGFGIWDKWSATANNYPGSDACRKVWDGVKPDGRATFGTLAKRAREAGWAPDVETDNEAIIADLNGRFGIVARGKRPYVFDKQTEPRGGLFEPMSFETFRARMAKETRAWVPGKRVKGGDNDDGVFPINRGKFWLDSEKSSHYAHIIFDPGLAPGHNDDNWNIWQGFAVQPRKEGDWSLFKEFILNVMANGDQAVADWILNWMALALQQPGGPLGTGLVMKGAPGTGKTFFANMFGALFGRHYVAITAQSQVTGNFNAHLEAKRFVFLDEAVFAGDRRNLGNLKSMMTNPMLMIERKGQDTFPIDNHMIFAMASNERAATPADLGERRWMVVRMSNAHKEDHAYFGTVAKQMLAEGGLEAMLHDLLARDLSEGPDPRLIIKTVELTEDWLAFEKPEVRFVHSFLDAGVLPGSSDDEPNVTTNLALWENFRAASGSVAYSDAGTLGKRVLEIIPGIHRDQRKVTKGDASGSRSRRYVFPSLMECRRAFEAYCGLPVTWDDGVREWGSSDEELPF